ncbi:glycosyltransferase family 92 protein [Desulfovibrio cuneatus]|uniref:glycosyltransferase family 92 protein n=1 Tax=Desulfovibrio cuneatus TaxID=159728 RepID=UPI0003FCEFE1|nr:glycosyltransferase family 92 protein [Desulfovibrio cuneatus]
MQYAALCCIAKDEDLFLHEWVAYHTLLGFEHIFIYDNCSAVPITQLLGPWASHPVVTVYRNAAESNQDAVYTDCWERHGHEFKWIAFLDADEFLRLNETSDVRLFLAEFEPYAGVAINWRMFGSSGHTTTPQGLVLANYTACLGDDVHTKTIVQPALVNAYANPHAFHPKAGLHSVTPEHIPVPPGFPLCIPQTQRASIHHYYYKAAQCFQRKIDRGNPCHINRKMDDFTAHLAKSTRQDTTLAAMAPAVQRIITTGKLPNPGQEALQGLPAAAGQLALQAQNTAAFLAAASTLLCKGSLTQQEAHCVGLCLCYATLHANQEEQGVIWSARAELALHQGNATLARFCLHQSLAKAATKQVYLLLARMQQEAGDREGAKYALQIVRRPQ